MTPRLPIAAAAVAIALACLPGRAGARPGTTSRAAGGDAGGVARARVADLPVRWMIPRAVRPAIAAVRRAGDVAGGAVREHAAGRVVLPVLVRRPVAAAVSSPFGRRRDPITGRRSRHTGVDFDAGRGDEVRACGPGIVIRSGRARGYGRVVVIAHGFGLTTRYAHLGRRLAREGDRVAAGEPVGTVGASGRATGAHLHFEVRRGGRPVDPARALAIPLRPIAGPRHD